MFVVYLAACVATYLVPSSLGENVARLRFAAVPIAVLALSLRHWRPRLVAFAALALAVSWNLTPLAGSYVKSSRDAAGDPAYWQPVIAYLHKHLTPSYRVEAVDTAAHWPAVYLARAGIPLARGWFRQDDFPQNELLYSRVGRRAYHAWLRTLGIRYVVLTNAPTDYSAGREAALLRSGRSGLTPVWRNRHATVYEVPSPRPLITGRAPARVLALTQARVLVSVSRAGFYRLAVRWSPYWKTSAGCLSKRRDGMITLAAHKPGRIQLVFDVDAGRAFAAMRGKHGPRCASVRSPVPQPRAAVPD